MRIVGTAGHVDHGKSSLVISLTGYNPDRWIEERERGMTLDLGFAPLRFADGTEAGIIDVPGHERFLHNMLAGAAGIDVLLLVVDAVEGPRAQTIEHLQILNFLNVRRAIVVLTKSDLVDAGQLENAARLAREVSAGTIAHDAPVIAVSNLTGAGIDALKSAIHDALVALPPLRADAPAYLPVDRVFALPGHGTIVTGTLMQGTIGTGDTLALHPSGRTARVRSLQIFGRKVKSADPGSRVAVNLTGVDVETIERGDVVSAVDAFEPTSEVFVDFTPLPEAVALLHRRTPVRVHIGAAEIEGRLVFSERPAQVRRVQARVLLKRPTVCYRGARMILRRLSPKDLLGGAIVVDPLPDGRVDRAADADDLDDRAPLTADELASFETVERAGLHPLSAKKVAIAANVREDAAQAVLVRLLHGGRIAAIPRPLEYVSRAAYDAAFERAEILLRERHEHAPWRLGCSTSEIAAAVGVGDAVAVRLLAAWHDDGRVGHRAHYWHLPSFTPSLTKEQRSFFESALAAGAQGSPLVPASFDAVTSAGDAGRVAGAREALESLIATGALTRIGDDLYRRSQLERARALVVEALRRNPSGATMSLLRDELGTSRKYALPLLEHFDSIGVTVRDGDLRRLRAPAGRAVDEIQL